MAERATGQARADKRSDGRADRVAIVHRQTRPTLVVAAAFIVAAAISAVVPHDTGIWLPLHLFLLGGVLSAISGATQFLAVTWSAAPAPPDSLVGAQRIVLAASVIGLAVAREVDTAPAWRGIAGGGLIAALVLLAVLLVRIRITGTVDRFRPAIDGYLIAIAVGVVGSIAGVILVVGSADDRYAATRSMHLSTNLLGLVGLVIAATLPFMIATQARMKMSPRATSLAVRATVIGMATATAIAALGLLAERPKIAAVGFGAYVVGIAAVVALLPRLGSRQYRWAGPRLAQVGAGVLWWAGSVIAMAVYAWRDEAVPTQVLLALVIGGYAQILIGSLAYLGPVLRAGRGHERLSEGFRLTRSYLGFVAANVAVIAMVAEWTIVTGIALAVWVIDGVVRTSMLVGMHDPQTGTSQVSR